MSKITAEEELIGQQRLVKWPEWKDRILMSKPPSRTETVERPASVFVATEDRTQAGWHAISLFFFRCTASIGDRVVWSSKLSRTEDDVNNSIFTSNNNNVEQMHTTVRFALLGEKFDLYF
jgi:hypothetical protein